MNYAPKSSFRRHSSGRRSQKHAGIFFPLLVIALLLSPAMAPGEAAAQDGWWDSVLEDRDGRAQERGGVEQGDRDDDRSRRFPRQERSERRDDDDRRSRDDDGRRDRDDNGNRDDDDWNDDEWDDDNRDDGDWRNSDGRWERREDRRDRGNGKRGPKFCRTGEGHPVFGMEWCRDRGFGDGRWDDDDDRWERRRDGRWERQQDWGDIIFGDRGDDRRDDRRRGTLSEGVLGDILGSDVLRRLQAQSRALNRGSDIDGRWVRGSGATRVLQLRADGRPLAELADYDGDGRVDIAVMAR